MVTTWRMLRARRDPWAVATLALAFVPWLGGLRALSLVWLARTATDGEARRRWARLGAGLGLLLLAGASWFALCGGVLAGMAVFGTAPSLLGAALFVAVPVALGLIAAGTIVWRLESPERPVSEAVPIVALWWIVSAVAAFVICFAV
jgi:hypothetical protein